MVLMSVEELYSAYIAERFVTSRDYRNTSRRYLNLFLADHALRECEAGLEVIHGSRQILAT